MGELPLETERVGNKPDEFLQGVLIAVEVFENDDAQERDQRRKGRQDEKDER